MLQSCFKYETEKSQIQKFSTIIVFKPIFLFESQIDLAKTVLKKRQFHLNTKLRVH